MAGPTTIPDVLPEQKFVNHSFDFSIYRRERVTKSGGEVGRLSIAGGAEVKMLSVYRV